MKGVSSMETIPLLSNWVSSTEEKILKTRKGYNIPQRWVFAIMGFLGLFNAYAMRVCLSITITEMVVPEMKGTDYNNTAICLPMDDEEDDDMAVVSDSSRYHWDEYTQGIILSSFYWGYVITHLPGGMLAEKFGGKYSLGLGILSTAIFTLVTPVAVKWGEDTALIVLRILMGLGEGTTFPALNAMLSQWTPPEERSKIGSMVFAGAQLGTVVATSVSGALLHHLSIGWPVVFYVFGTMGVIWFIVWVLICYNNPYEHPFISEREQKFLHDRMSAHTHKKVPAVPWTRMLTSLPVWALIAAQIGHDWGFFTMVTDLPKYMSDVLRFPIKKNGLLSALPYLAMWICSIVTSWVADWLITRGFMSTTNVRKMGTTIASLGPGAFIIGASYAECDRDTVVVMFTVGMTLMGTFYPGMKVNALDLSPNYSGTLMAVVNGIGAFTGILTPYIVGVLVTDHTLEEWRLVFWIVLGVFIVTNLIFIMFASGEVQYWNDPEFVLADRQEKLEKAAEKKRAKAEKSAV